MIVICIKNQCNSYFLVKKKKKESNLLQIIEVICSKSIRNLRFLFCFTYTLCSQIYF